MAQPKFEFRLEALLTHRAHIEKEKQRKMALIHQEIQILTRELQEAQRRISAEDRSLTARELTGRLDMQYIAHEKRYVGNLHLKIALGAQKLAGLEQKFAAARAELLEAARARKVIDKLKEKQLARWRAELDRKESAINDEIGNQLAQRQIAETSAYADDSPAELELQTADTAALAETGEA